MSYLEQCIEKLSLTPNDTNRYLRLIRDLDRRIETIQSTLIPKQKEFIQKVRLTKDKKQDLESPDMIRDYNDIILKEKLIIGFAKEKTHIANQLQEEILQQSDRLKQELNQKFKQRAVDDNQLQLPKKNKQKFEQKSIQKDQWYYDNSQPKYCYCGKASFGEMVACQNTFCQKEWFHLQCIEEKNLPQKWYCAECKKLKEKTRNQVIKSYL